MKKEIEEDGEGLSVSTGAIAGNAPVIRKKDISQYQKQTKADFSAFYKRSKKNEEKDSKGS